jgi:hypothetical protein
VRAPTAWIPGLAAVALLLAGCGGSQHDNGESKKTGPVVASDSAAALESAGAVHVAGTAPDAGKPQQIDLQLQGTDASGSITLSGTTVMLVALGGKTYANAPASFWAGNGVPPTVAPVLNNRWVLVPSTAASSFSSDVSVAKIADEIRHPQDSTIVPQVRTGKDAGSSVVIVTEQDGSELHVAATGAPYPLHLLNKGSSPADITLSAFGQRQAITAPPNALDLSTLSG